MGSQTKLRVLFVINSLAGGGAERVFTTLVRELAARGGDLSPSVALLDEEAEEAYGLPPGVPVARLDTGGSMLRSIGRLRELVRRDRPDVTVSFLSRANVAAVLAMAGSGRPTVISERVNTTAHLKSGRFSMLSRLLIRGLYPAARRVIAVSDGVARTLETDFAVRPERIRVIYNPVDIDGIAARAAQEPAIAAGPGDFVTMGRLVENKNTAMAIRALAQCSAGGRLIVLGDGPLRAELGALAASLGLADRVVFAGFLSNPHAVLSRAGCYLLTSNAEGFPNAMMEAMAVGLPIVATDCPSGPAEILQTNLEGRASAMGSGGALVRMDDAAAMAQCMDRLIAEPGRGAAAHAARMRAADFSVESAVDGFTAAIRESAVAAGGPGR